jgi:hypothetical protein
MYKLVIVQISLGILSLLAKLLETHSLLFNVFFLKAYNTYILDEEITFPKMISKLNYLATST